MDIHLYIPALITLGAAIVSFIAGGMLVLANFTDEPAGRHRVGVAIGIIMVYAAPIAALIALGMQIAHWV